MNIFAQRGVKIADPSTAAKAQRDDVIVPQDRIASFLLINRNLSSCIGYKNHTVARATSISAKPPGIFLAIECLIAVTQAAPEELTLASSRKTSREGVRQAMKAATSATNSAKARPLVVA